MRILLGQISPVIGDIDGNLKLCQVAVQQARERGCDLVVLPELALSGYPPRDLLQRADLLDSCESAARELAALSTDRLIVVFGVPWREVDGLHNTAIVAHGGHILHRVHKTLLPTYDVFDEHRYFVPEADPHPVDVGGLSLGVTICEDLWHLPGEGEPSGVSRPAQTPRLDPIARMKGCDVVLNLSASPFHAGKGQQRLDLVQRQARRVGAPLVYCNMVGGNDELLFDGDSLVVAADGRLLAQGPAFSSALVEVDLGSAGVAHRSAGFEEEVAQALEMGVRDYAGRCGFTKAVFGLSGGIDSALVAAIAARALGPEHVLAIGMPGPFSSRGSVDDSVELARNLGIRFETVGIGDIHRSYLDALGPLFEGLPTGIAEENLQARARGNLVMAVSNKMGHLVLTTGNKSEVAVGYSTLYGDMSGGLAVIADVFKTDVYRLSRWYNREREIIPQAILDKAPSAELAPDQKDQDSLPPYEELDAILRLYVEGVVDPAHIIAQGHDPQTVRRVVRMVVRAEYKRWQAAPALRVSPKAFGTGRRLPLAQRWHLGLR